MTSNGHASGRVQDGLRSVEAEFFTEHFMMRGRVTSPELRLSDHLNNSTATFKLCASHVQRRISGLDVNVAAGQAYLTKAHLLFALPLAESGGGGPLAAGQTPRNPSWIQTTTRVCWAGIDQYTLVGRVHVDASNDPRLFLRSLEDRRFLPITNAQLTLPDGSVREFATVIVNRLRLEVLAIRSNDEAVSGGATARGRSESTEQAAP
jgi:hypothetical protein